MAQRAGGLTVVAVRPRVVRQNHGQSGVTKSCARPIAVGMENSEVRPAPTSKAVAQVPEPGFTTAYPVQTPIARVSEQDLPGRNFALRNSGD